ncbi:MAG: caspase family protein [Bacteroidales bacterium]|nr:caspase family protein [Bacteroidales bacterium]MBK7626956.1 caspase family protein [Bacteroidales bacterium]
MFVKRLFFVTVVSFAALIAMAQDKVSPSDYTFSKGLKSQIVLNDDFSKFNNYWLLGIEENSWSESIEDGHLVFQSLTDKAKEDLLPVIIDQKRNFEIETSIRFVEGKMDKGYGLQWGKAINPLKQFDFLLTGSGHFTIDKYTGDFKDYVPFTLSDKVNRYAFNKLTVRKVADTYYFFLNEKLVHSMPFEPFFGNLLGFQVAENSTIRVDNIEIAYLDKAAEGKSKVLIMDYKFDSNNNKVSVGKPVTLTLNVSNVGDKDASDLTINYKLPANIEVVDFKNVTALKKGEEQLLSLQFFATKNYTDSIIPVKFEIAGADITNVNDIDLTVGLDKPVKESVDKTMAQNYSEFRGGNDPLKGLNVAQAMKSVEVGEYYGLVIGIDQYSGEWPMLKNAVNDAKGVAELLSSKYTFHYMKTLYDKDATRDNILKEFEYLLSSVKANDNVLIYYSGHGEYIENMDKGFWVPVDAAAKSISKYISNEDIRAFLTGIKSKHTLLVTDACFSGDIFRGKTMTIPYENSTKYYSKMYSLSSRKAITSGGVEPVMDKGKENHSIFAYYFLQALKNNTEKYFDAGQVFDFIKIPVVNNSYQTPAYSPIRNAGDEGGQFIFIMK